MLAHPPQQQFLRLLRRTLWTALTLRYKLHMPLAAVPISAACIRTAILGVAQAVQGTRRMQRVAAAWIRPLLLLLLLSLATVAAVQTTTATSGAVGR